MLNTGEVVGPDGVYETHVSGSARFHVTTIPFIMNETYLVFGKINGEGVFTPAPIKAFRDAIGAALYVREWQADNAGSDFPYDLFEVRPVRLVKQWGRTEDVITGLVHG